MMRSSAFWISTPTEGRLAIMARPRAGEWLEDEVAAWRADGVTDVVCLLEDDEVEELGLEAEPALCRAAGIKFTPFPIRDRGVPSSMSQVMSLAGTIVDKLRHGGGVAIHCRAGIGRSSLIAACALVRCGIAPTVALERIAATRGVAVPDTDEQRSWVAQFALAAKGSDDKRCIS